MVGSSTLIRWDSLPGALALAAPFLILGVPAPPPAEPGPVRRDRRGHRPARDRASRPPTTPATRRGRTTSPSTGSGGASWSNPTGPETRPCSPRSAGAATTPPCSPGTSTSTQRSSASPTWSRSPGKSIPPRPLGHSLPAPSAPRRTPPVEIAGWALVAVLMVAAATPARRGARLLAVAVPVWSVAVAAALVMFRKLPDRVSVPLIAFAALMLLVLPRSRRRGPRPTANAPGVGSWPSRPPCWRWRWRPPGRWTPPPGSARAAGPISR